MTTIVDGNLGIFTTGNVTANNFFGNIDSNSITIPGSNTQILYNNNGNLGSAAGLTYDNANNIVGISGDLIPAANASSRLGNATNQWKDMWVSGNTIYIENIPLTMAAGANLQVAGSNVLTVSPSGVMSAASVTAGSITSNLLTINQDASIGGNLTINGNVTANGNIQIISGNSGQFFGNVITGANALYAGIPVGYSAVQQCVLQLATNFNGSTQLNAQNINSGSQASFEYVATADNGDDFSRYVSLGIASSTWDGTSPESLGNAVSPGDGFLYTDLGNLVLGTNTPAKVVKINVGAPDNTGAVAQFNEPNTLSTSPTTGAFTVIGGIAATSNIVSGGNITAGNLTTVGNLTAGNIIGTVIGTVANANYSAYAGNVTIAAQPNITSVGTLLSLGVSGNITAGNVSATDISGTTLGGSLTTAAQPNITSVGVLTSLAVTGNVSGGNVNTTGIINAGSLGGLAATGVGATGSWGISVTGSATTITQAAQPNITSVGTLTSLGVTGNITAGNVSATTFTGNFVGNFSSPGTNTQVLFNDGGIANAVAGMTFDKTINLLSVAGNIAGANLTTIGNVVGGLFVGDGGALSNITGANVTGVVANANYAAYAGNITIANQPNITGLGTLISLAVTGNVTAGNMYANSGTIGAQTITATGTLSGGNITTAGNISATGNISGGNLTTGGQVVATGNLVSSANINGVNFNASGNLAVTGNAAITGNVAGGNISTVGEVSATGNVSGGNITTGGQVVATGNLVSSANINGVNFNASGNLAVTGNAAITGNVSGGNLTTGGQVVATGNLVSSANINGVNFNASGNLAVTGNAAITGNLSGGNISTAGTVAAVGNISGGNITTVGEVVAVGNVSGGNLTTAGQVSAVGNVSGGNLTTVGNITATGNISATGNVSGGNITTVGEVVATGNVSGGNLTTGGQVVATGNLVTSANINGVNFNASGNLGVAGNASITGNLTAGNVSAAVFTGNLVGNVTGNLAAPGANTQVLFNDAGTANANSTMTFDKITSLFTIGGNIVGGNINTAGAVVATGNISGANANITTNVNAGNLVSNFLKSNGLDLTIAPSAVNKNILMIPTGTGNVDVATRYITSLADPVNNQDAATKAYVDQFVQGVLVKSSVRVATTTGLPAYSYNNGTAGVGATITALSTGILTVDGVNTVLGDRILVKNETAGLAISNGIYVVTTEGTAGVAYVLTRSTDMDSANEISGAFTFVQSGSTNADSGWVCTADAPVTIGTTAITWSQFSGAGSYTAGSGINLTGSTFSANVDGTTTAIVAGNIAVPAGAVLTNPNITDATGTSLTLSGNAIAPNVNATLTVTAPMLTSNVATGTAPITVTSTTRVANLNVNYANVSDFSVVTTQSTGVFYPTFVNSSATGNLALASNTALSFNVATGALISTLLGGTLTTAAQPNITSVGTLTSLAVTGNVGAGNLNTLGAVVATGNISGGNISASGIMAAVGNVSGGNITTGGNVSASGNLVTLSNVNGVNFNGTGNAVLTGNISSGNATITANLSSGNIAASGNIRSTSGFFVGDGGFLSNLTVAAGDIILNGTSNVSIPDVDGNILFNVGGLLAGKISSTTTAIGLGSGAAGLFSTAIGSGAGGSAQGAQGVAIGYNAGSSGQGASAVAIGTAAGQSNQPAGSIAINASGAALNPSGAGFFVNPVRTNASNIGTPVFFNDTTKELTYSTSMALTGNITAGNVYANAGTIGASLLTGTLTTAAQPNITSVGTLTSLAVTGNITSGNISTGNITLGGGAVLSGDGSGLTSLNASNISSGTLDQARLANSSLTVNGVSITLGSSGTVTANAQTLSGTSLNSTVVGSSLTSVGTLGSLAVTGTTTSGTVQTASLTTGAAATAGSITGTWTLTAGSKLEATYADMAERYTSDAKYEPGTVLMIGGTAETTIATEAGKTRIAGIVSSEPAYILNSTLKDSVVIALIGRVPCKVVGTIMKGDLLTVSHIDGVATSAITHQCGTIIGRALESYDSTEVGIIEVKVDKG